MKKNLTQKSILVLTLAVLVSSFATASHAASIAQVSQTQSFTFFPQIPVLFPQPLGVDPKGDGIGK